MEQNKMMDVLDSCEDCSVEEAGLIGRLIMRDALKREKPRLGRPRGSGKQAGDAAEGEGN